VLVPVLWLPTAALAAGYVRSRGLRGEDDRVLLGLGAWTLMHAAAIALARGARGAGPASRYMDILAVGLVVNIAAALALTRRVAPPHRHRLARAALAAWLLVPGIAGFELLRTELRHVQGNAALLLQQVRNVRRYIATDDMSTLRDKPFQHIPYPAADPLADRLRSPYIRSILPPSVRRPLHLEPEERGPFTWGSLPPGAPADPVRLAWSSWGKPSGGVFRFRSSGGTLPYLEFECLGEPAGEARFLDVVAASGARMGLVPLPPRTPGWRSWAVRNPGPDGRIVTIDERMDSRFAFREPVEMGALSFWSERILRHGEKVAGAGAAVTIAGLLGAAGVGLRRRCRHPTRQSPTSRLRFGL